MKAIAVSDTHNDHHKIIVPDGDFFIFAGDATINGTYDELADFFKWVRDLPHRYKVITAGNHDAMLQDHAYKFTKFLDANTVYLDNEGAEMGGYRFYASPNVPRTGAQSFGREKGQSARSVYRHIPADTQILVTHTPPRSILDKPGDKDIQLGCPDLIHKVNQLKHLKAHIFGHIHSSHGHLYQNGVDFYNVAYLTRKNRRVTTFELD